MSRFGRKQPLVFPRNRPSLNSLGAGLDRSGSRRARHFRLRGSGFIHWCAGYKLQIKFNPNWASGLLKYLNSLYRPALPKGNPQGRSCRFPAVGASPSGKAVDFDSTMRRFESSRPSQNQPGGSATYRIWQIFILNGRFLPVLFRVSLLNIKRAIVCAAILTRTTTKENIDLVGCHWRGSNIGALLRFHS